MDTITNEKASMKRAQLDTEDEDKQVGQRARITSSSPPEDNKFLRDYCTGDWWKDGITEGEKQSRQFQLIQGLRNDDYLFAFAQARLKIKLRLFLDTGQVAFLERASHGTAGGRVASLDYDIQDSQLLYQRDFNAFSARVEKLFEWKESEHREYMAPYFPLIQSSGTGKTKLMHEYRRSVLDNSSNVHCELILCHHGSTEEIASPWDKGGIYSGKLDVRDFQTDEEGREKLWFKLTKIVQTIEQQKEKEKLVFLFDESQHLVKHGDGWHFRSIRWWLRKQLWSDIGVVCIFAGTNTSLANYFAEPIQSTSSRDPSSMYNKGSKLYPPFYEITTTGLESRMARSSAVGHRRTTSSTEFDVAVQYGRPLFARMHLKGELNDDALGAILMRMRGWARDNTRGLGSVHQQQQQQHYDFSILATRLQMGQVPFDFASKQVSSGYAHLTYFAPEQTAVADIAYLPDPVCAWLAMTQMIAGFNHFEIVNHTKMKPSEPPSAWSKKAIRMYSSGLCRPEKGDVGEVAAAFYMLVCGDALRYEDRQDLTKLSVSLEEWLHRLRKGNLHPNPNHDGIKIVPGTGRPSVNFIQVCRNYLRPSLREIQDGELLKHWYQGARACYAHASCQAYDLLVPVQYRMDRAGKEGEGDTDDVDLCYCPMLVSVKNRSSYSEKQREAAVHAMETMLESSKIKTGVCMLLLIGLESPSPSTSEFVFSPSAISTVIIEVPKNDDFGATDLASCSTCAGGERSEVMVSHAELALGAEQTFKRLLRSKTKEDDPSAVFLEDVKEGYKEARARLS